MPKKFWQFRNKTQSSVELILYGEISETSWWGDEVTPKEFEAELRAAGAVDEITVRINSGGGDVFAAQTIGNLLESHPANVTAKIDGLCASAATIIACKCGKVIAANDSTYMIHPASVRMSGYYSAPDLESLLDALRVIKENIISVYVKKTGRDKDEITAMMDATSWWTGAEAKENGFVDELTDNEAPTIENRGGLLFINSIKTGLAFAEAPSFVQDSLAAAPAAGRFEDTAGRQEHPTEEESDMEVTITTVDQLRKAYPDLVIQIENEAAERATNEERARIKSIDEMTPAGCESIATSAKYVKPLNASDYAVNLVKTLKNQGAVQMTAMQQDVSGSGVNSIGAALNEGQQSGNQGSNQDEFMNALKKTEKK